MKYRINRIIFIILLVFCILDILNISNEILQFITGIISCIAIFYLGASRFALKKANGIELLVINSMVLFITAQYKVYLFNIFILSALLWIAITPALIKYKRIFEATVVFAILTVYLCSLFGINITLFPIVYYPVYVLGYRIGSKKFEKGKGGWKNIVLNILFPLLLLLPVSFKAQEMFIDKEILFLRLYTAGPATALYLPVITLFYLWMSLSISMLIYLSTNTEHESSPAAGEIGTDLGGIKKGANNLIKFLSGLCVMLFLGEYTLWGQWGAAFDNMLAPQGILNLLFLAAVYLTLISILGRGLATALLSVTTLILAAANFIKIKFFNEPFYPWDIYLIKNAIMISKRYIDFKIITMLIFFGAGFVFILIRYRGFFKRSLACKPVFALLPLAACTIMANAVMLGNSGYLSELNMGKSWYVGMGEMLGNGMFIQNFFYLTELNEYITAAPKEYSYDKMMEINEMLGKDNTERASTEEKPNIIVVMSETFWDPTKLNGVSFTKDITENLKKYQKGEIVSPVFGGGTANTEFEALTGLSTFFMKPGIIPYNVYLRRDTPSIASVLKDNGYSTTAIHPNTGEFYNRTTVYKHFGFDEFIDSNGFTSMDIKGANVSDDSVVDKILTVLNNEDDKPKFIFAVTMQNHDPYYDVYDDLEVYAESDKLDDVETSILSNYAQGIYDADRSLGKLIEEVNAMDTPTVVYFFGDHLPRLGSPRGIYDIYNKLDFFSDVEHIQTDIRLYETPLAAWANYKAMDDFNTPISPAHIAFEVLKDSQVNSPNYFNILDELRKVFPVLQNNVNEKESVAGDLIQVYKLIQYDLLFGKQYLNS